LSFRSTPIVTRCSWVQRERGEEATSLDIGTAVSANGDLPTGRPSRREAQIWAKHYLNIVGLPLPADARLIQVKGNDDFTYQCHDGHGVARTLRVWVDPRDGSLEHLQNVIYRRHPGAVPSTSVALAAVPSTGGGLAP
jgi:hypothetical protein